MAAHIKEGMEEKLDLTVENVKKGDIVVVVLSKQIHVFHGGKTTGSVTLEAGEVVRGRVVKVAKSTYGGIELHDCERDIHFKDCGLLWSHIGEGSYIVR